MSLTLRDQTIGNQVFFAREGTTIDGVVVAADAKPDATPSTNWTLHPIGTVEECRITPTVERIKRYAPSPGSYRLRKQITTRRELVIRLTIQELSETFWELLLLSGTEIKTGALDYVPMAGNGIVRGWFKFQQYDADDTLRNAMDLWCEANTEESTMGKDLLSYPLILNVISNPLNNATFVL
jgi:hypothetical protein